MHEVSETCSLDDDMVDGDLGDGMGVRTAPSSTRTRTKSESFAGPSESLLLKTELLKCSSRAGEADWVPAMKTAETQQRARWKLLRFSSLVDLSKDELKERLQEATEMIDALCCELDVTHRYLEGKYEALKILQGKAILDKATTHTKSLLQKSEEKAKALEKEVNSLQWELSFLQVQMKKSEQSWEYKYNRMSSENKILTNSLQEIENENQQLRAENSALSQQYLELLSMLNVKEQRIYQATKPQYSLERESSVLELTVLGACQCLGVAEACPCSRTAAATRKQLVQLKQEVWDADAAISAEMLRSPSPWPPPALERLDAQHSRKEEALMVADAFRIAFEQQLRKRSEDFLLLAETNIQKSNHCKAEGANRSPLISVSKRLKALLPSSLEIKMRDELLETLYRLQDLLNDKEEALAHQRKVSIMLAHSADELQRQLHLGSNDQLQDPPESAIQLKQPQDPSGDQSHSQKTCTSDSDVSRMASTCKVQNQLNRELPDSQL